ncbi:hypothetical protein D3C79_811870 [compost metagenome]
MGEVLDVVAEDLVVADQGQHVVRGVDRGSEETDLSDRTDHAAGADEVTDLERAQDDNEGTGRQVGQQPRPGHADGQTDRGKQRGEGSGLHAEVTEDADHQDDVQCHGDDRADIAQHGRVELLLGQGPLHHADGKTDQPASDDPEGNGGENLDRESGPVLLHQRDQRVELLGGHVNDGFVHGWGSKMRDWPQNASTSCVPRQLMGM